MVSKDKRSSKPEGTRARHGGRVVLSLDVDPRVRDALRDRATASGVSMAEYIANAVARPEPSYPTRAVEIAQPLTQISYRLAQATRAMESSDVALASDELAAAKRIAADALISLQRRHVEEVRSSDPRCGGGWTG